MSRRPGSGTGTVPKTSGYGRPVSRSSGYGPPGRSSGYGPPGRTAGPPGQSSGYGRPPTPSSGPPQRGRQPERSVIIGQPGRSSAYGRPGASSTMMEQADEPPPPQPVKPKFKIPALSVPFKARPLDPFLERLKKRTVRRNAPAGEDSKKIKDIIKSLNQEVVSVQEYVGLVSPYTGDGGEVLRTIMADDLCSFRKMAKAVYDTMTKDVGDVLTNEQIYVTSTTNERYNIYQDNICRTLRDIRSYIPKFDFEKYLKDPDYITKFFPPIEETYLDPGEDEAQRRQLVYHRLEWLRSEGARLNDENQRLQSRLKELKQQQKDELMVSRQQEEIAEDRKNQLEATEADLQNELEELNESVQQTFAKKEEVLRVTSDREIIETASKKKLKEAAKKAAKAPVKKPKPWNVKAAQAIESENIADTVNATASNAAFNITGATKKKPAAKAKIQKQPRAAKEAFHYSPIKTPPKPRERSLSPFHYSPPKSPQRERPFRTEVSATSDAQVRPGSSVETVQVETKVVDRSNARPLPPGRRGLAPRDTWGGFG